VCCTKSAYRFDARHFTKTPLVHRAVVPWSFSAGFEATSQAPRARNRQLRLPAALGVAELCFQRHWKISTIRSQLTESERVGVHVWDNQFVFVLSALVGVAVWIFIFKRHEARKTNRSPRLVEILLALFLIGVALALVTRCYFYRNSSPLIPGPGTALSFVIGSVVGSFSARFVWSLYGARFGARDPLIGVLTLLLLILVYSLPVYQNEISSLLNHIGLSSLKTPFIEVTFTEPSQFSRVTGSAASPRGEEHPSALARPSYPLPGLIGLQKVVDEGPDDYLVKDARYIAYFDGRGDFQPGNVPPDAIDGVLLASRNFLRPVKTLARCLRAYVKVIPDSQLLLIDIKPVIQFFFDMNAKAVLALTNQPLDHPDQPDHPDQEFKTLSIQVGQVVDNVRAVLPNVYPQACPEVQKDKTTGQPLVDRVPDLQNFSYLQPYVAMTLAYLLVAHGSPDEAIDVLAQWLLLWSCARGDDPERTGCDLYRQSPAAGELPEWFRIRAEFELVALLFQQAGASNIPYHDFLGDLTNHFIEFNAKPQFYDRRRHHPAIAVYPPAGISIGTELQRCEQRKAFTDKNMSGEQQVGSGSPDVRMIMLRQLLQNENDLLRSDLHFLGDTWVEMENLYDRALVLTRLHAECLSLGQDENYWKATLADYKITSGLVALAIANKLASRATSADERHRAGEIEDEGKKNLRDGYRVLDEVRREEREHLKRKPWSERLFEVSHWEESYALAERAIRRLNEGNP